MKCLMAPAAYQAYGNVMPAFYSSQYPDFPMSKALYKYKNNWGQSKNFSLGLLVFTLPPITYDPNYSTLSSETISH